MIVTNTDPYVIFTTLYVIMQAVIMLNVVILNVVAPFVQDYRLKLTIVLKWNFLQNDILPLKIHLSQS
jgi:hypothetical protein